MLYQLIGIIPVVGIDNMNTNRCFQVVWIDLKHFDYNKYCSQRILAEALQMDTIAAKITEKKHIYKGGSIFLC